MTVTAPANCSWTSRSNINWITGLAANTSASGNALLSYAVDANSGTSARTGTLTMGGQTLTVTQGGATFLQVSGNYTLQLKVSGSCTWDAVQVEPPGFGNAPPPPFVYPLTTFQWPVTVTVDTYVNGITSGWVQDSPPTFRTGLDAGPNSSSIGDGFSVNDTSQNGHTPDGQSTRYVMAVSWSGNRGAAPTRAADGRGEILNGATGELHARLWERTNYCGALFAGSRYCDTGREWICGQYGPLPNTWSLKAR